MAADQGQSTLVEQARDAASPLSRLKLTNLDLDALRAQGFVNAEQRGNNRTVYKLRFRVGGRQQVRSLGSDAVFAAAVAEEVRRLQRLRRQKRRLRQLQKEVAIYRKEVKAALHRHVKEAGFRFHGYSVRRPRSKRG